MKKLIRKKMKELGYIGTVIFKKHSEFGEHYENPAIHQRLLDINYDLEDASSRASRDMFDTIIFYLESKSHYEMRERLENKKTVWTEGHINSLRKQLGYCSNWSDIAVEVFISDYFGHGEQYDFEITEYQTTKGLDWLLNNTFKKNGDVRKSKSMILSDPEHFEIVKNFKEFRFIGLRLERNNSYNSKYSSVAPIYRVLDNNGDYFDYSPIAFGETVIL